MLDPAGELLPEPEAPSFPDAAVVPANTFVLLVPVAAETVDRRERTEGGLLVDPVATGAGNGGGTVKPPSPGLVSPLVPPPFLCPSCLLSVGETT